MNDAERWDKKWAEETHPSEPSAFFLRWLPRLLSHLRRRPGTQVLDVACGTGRHTLPLARAGVCVEAADISEVALEKLAVRARHEALSIHTRRLDLSNQQARKLEIRTYDTILDFFYLERPLFPVLARAARPDALLLFETRLAGPVGTATNLKGFWLAPGEIQKLLWRDWKILELFEGELAGGALVQVAARRR
ncbi:MAG: class I SAM-dependent methyltransferase [Bdellovibrionota bacterium]